MQNRVQRVNALLKEELNKIFLKELDFGVDILVTITRVDTFSNLIEAKVYISVMPEDKSEYIFSIFKREIYNIQQILNKRLNMRPVPKIVFEKEKMIIEAGKIEEILEQLKKEGK